MMCISAYKYDILFAIQTTLMHCRVPHPPIASHYHLPQVLLRTGRGTQLWPHKAQLPHQYRNYLGGSLSPINRRTYRGSQLHYLRAGRRVLLPRLATAGQAGREYRSIAQNSRGLHLEGNHQRQRSSRCWISWQKDEVKAFLSRSCWRE